ncbi:MAG: N-acetyl-gamma-glutamyl-phosphate reductase [Woeseia sp.]|nr:N-acetyl-gamma-glutamyl-phosphate reductase [Woeseia sp.]MBT8095792.1 N-acetyl-gamma-glutamyl-phosphate reductase [Woeseia sp.]NNE61758.1 N-acetyl-gamma-glutamyl-phosphate reductase [Woeseia sp.]NNL54171.1 N-acetyl-gamma-glutamyl-phosphate reductase [Woeseia sp.]
MTRKIPAAVLGATGYVGGELLRLLAAHPGFELRAAVSTSKSGQTIDSVFPALSPAYPYERFCSLEHCETMLGEIDELALFSTAPHGASAALVARLLDSAQRQNVTVHTVDSSADFRYPDHNDYSSVYDQAHGAPAILDQFVQGVPEQVPVWQAPHVGHPGCFATAALLAAVPLCLAQPDMESVFINGVTGSTGAGRAPLPGTHHPERHSNLYAYKPLAHRHEPEIEAGIRVAGGGDVRVNFVPHSGPFSRGIHVTLQAELPAPMTMSTLCEIYDSYYENAMFVQRLEGTPRIKNVVTSNHCHIGVAARGNTVVVMSVIDNLVKGAAGGAIQWMNRLYALPEHSGLTSVSPAWT